MIIAVDFDGTICEDEYPKIGKAKLDIINYLQYAKLSGDKIILWTCREGKDLEDAIKFCKWYGLEFDAVNDNLPENIEKYKNNTRKIFADIYIDDKSLNINR